MKKLRLLITEKCEKNCPGCCNNDWDLNALEIETDYSQYDLIMMTGGEPMLDPYGTVMKAMELYDKSKAKIVMYTADVGHLGKTLMVLSAIDGITVTLHDQEDAKDFVSLYGYLNYRKGEARGKTMRLNIFKDIDISHLPNLSLWKVKTGMEWIKNCSLPEGEVFKRYE